MSEVPRAGRNPKELAGQGIDSIDTYAADGNDLLGHSIVALDDMQAVLWHDDPAQLRASLRRQLNENGQEYWTYKHDDGYHLGVRLARQMTLEAALDLLASRKAVDTQKVIALDAAGATVRRLMAAKS
jgi:hypothetical protein